MGISSEASKISKYQWKKHTFHRNAQSSFHFFQQKRKWKITEKGKKNEL